MCLMVFFLLGGGSVFAWKPLTSPTSFSISQQHPALGATHNGLSEPSSSDSSSGSSHSSSSITYHGNSFLNEHADGHEGHDEDHHHATAGAADDELLLGHTEPRILHKEPRAFYGNSFYNSLHPSAVSIFFR